MPRLLCLRHHEEDHAGLLGEAFVERGFDITTVLVGPGSPPPALTGYDAVLILGSTSAVYDESVRRAWFDGEVEFIHEATRRGVPILGVCFGAQALCVAHGGSVAPSPSPEVGWFPVEAVNGSGLPVGPWFEFHYDRCELPAQAELWARNESAVQAFAIGDHVGVQFHPEVDEEQLAGWFAGGADEAARSYGHDLDQLLAQTRDEHHAARDRAGILVDLFLHRQK